MPISALIVARNEGHQLAACMETLDWADEIVVVLDRCTDDSADVARRFTDRILEGEWPMQGIRREAGIDYTTGPWVFELDADERVTPALAAELKAIGETDPAFDYAKIDVDNFIGQRLVRYGWGASFGKAGTMAVFRKGAKIWGEGRVHPSIQLIGRRGPDLKGRILHYVDEDVSDMIARLNRYTTSRAADMRDRGDRGSLPNDVRRFFSRFFKCYVRRKGYKEGGFGFVVALMAALFPILSTLKARLDPEAKGEVPISGGSQITGD